MGRLASLMRALQGPVVVQRPRPRHSLNAPGSSIPSIRSKLSVCNRNTDKCFGFDGLVMIDTGADTSFTSVERLRDIQRRTGELRNIRKVRAKTPGGDAVFVMTDEVRICLGRKKKLCTRSIAATPFATDPDIVLGADFLRANGCNIDFRKHVMACGRNKIAFDRA